MLRRRPPLPSFSNFGLQSLVGKPLTTISEAWLAGRDVQVAIERLLNISDEDAVVVDVKNRPAVWHASERVLRQESANQRVLTFSQKCRTMDACVELFNVIPTQKQHLQALALLNRHSRVILFALQGIAFFIRE